ncbi:hypothetical protein AMTR_s00001p00235590, partial [Amborella trichopoda]
AEKNAIVNGEFAANEEIAVVNGEFAANEEIAVVNEEIAVIEELVVVDNSNGGELLLSESLEVVPLVAFPQEVLLHCYSLDLLL